MDGIDWTSEPVVRLAAFAGVFAIMAMLELWIPRRALTQRKLQRWFTNLSMAALNGFVVRLMALFIVPLVAVAAAIYAASMGWGILNATDWPFWLEAVLAIVLLDLAIYVQHVVSHKFEILWRLHRVHHADPDIDLTTGVRFHPIEIALSMLYKVVLVLAIGPSAFAVVLFEVILNGCALFNHANIALPRGLDALVRAVLVTPDMHRVHHSVIKGEMNSNYGFNLSVWDRVFGTYTPQPKLGHDKMTIGLRELQDNSPTRLTWTLSAPILDPGNEQRAQQAPSDEGVN